MIIGWLKEIPAALGAASPLLVSLLIIGCSSSTPSEPPINEIPTTDVVATDAPEAELFARGKRYFERGIYGDAKEAYQAIMTNFPLGPYAEFAEIKYADSVFELGDYLTAATLYQDTLKNRPASENTPYVLYRAARALHLSQNGVGRDMTNLEKAIELYESLAQRFPNSPHTIASRQHQTEATSTLKAHHQSIANFYAKRENFKARSDREAIISAKFDPLEAESVSKLGSAKAKLAQESSATKPPTTDPVVVTRLPGGSSPKSAQMLRSTRTTQQADLATEITASHIECDLEGRFITLYLDRPVSSALIAEMSRKATITGTTTLITLPVSTRKGLQVECDDITAIMSNNQIKLSPPGAISGFALSYPPRVVLQLE